MARIKRGNDVMLLKSRHGFYRSYKIELWRTWSLAACLKIISLSLLFFPSFLYHPGARVLQLVLLFFSPFFFFFPLSRVSFFLMFQSKPNFLARIARAVERLLVDEEMKKRVRMRERKKGGVVLTVASNYSTCGWLTTSDHEDPNRKPINRSKHRGQTNLQFAGFEFDQAVIRPANGQ